MPAISIRPGPILKSNHFKTADNADNYLRLNLKPLPADNPMPDRFPAIIFI